MKYTCPLCGRKLSSNSSVIEHIKKEHVGRLSNESFEYLRELGVPEERIVRFCRENGIELNGW